MENVAPASFTDSDFEQLDAWLQKRRGGIFDIVTLEGFLTAIVIAPPYDLTDAVAAEGLG